MSDTGTTWVSDWRIMDDADHSTPLTSEVFPSQLALFEWVHRHLGDLKHAKEAGEIGGVYYEETRLPARFLVTAPEAEPYLAFGARIIETVWATPRRLIIGVPREHCAYLLGRLGSGLILRAGPFDSLEEARAQAHLGLWRVEDDWRVLAWRQ